MAELLPLIAIFIVAGFSAGVLAGLLGIGGGVIFVPMLFQIFVFFDIDPAVRMHSAVGTSLAIIIVTAIQSARAHNRHGGIDKNALRIWAPAIVFGVLAGSASARFLPSEILKLIYGLFSLGMAMRIIWPKSPGPPKIRPAPVWLQRVMAAFVGCFASLMGVGGGVFAVVFLTMFGHPIHRAVGTAAAIGFFVSVPGALGFMVAGFGLPGLPPFSIGYVNLFAVLLLIPITAIGAPIGANLAHRFRPRILEYFFCVFLTIAGVRILYDLFV